MSKTVTLCIGDGLGWGRSTARPTGRFFARLRRSENAGLSQEAEAEVHLPAQDAAAAASAVLERLQGAGTSLSGAQLHMQLGFTHSRVGWVGLDPGIKLTPSLADDCARGWIEGTLGLPLSGMAVRTQVIAGRGVLVFLVPEDTLVSMQAVAARFKLRMVSCKPAVLAAVESTLSKPGQDARDRTVVWTESAASARHPIVQLIQYRAGQLAGIWRGWLPAGEEGADLEGAVRRMQDRFAVVPGERQTVGMHWSAATQAPIH